MKLNFLSKTTPAFGLDISGGSFKLMRLETKGRESVVKAYTETAMPKALVVNDVISDAKTFDFLLKQSLDKPQYGQFGTKYVVASLPESKSFVRVIQIPKMSDSEAENAVPYEAESFIPMPIDQVYLDWQKIGGSASSPEGDKMNVLIIASPKEFVDKYLDLLDKSGLKPAALEVESQSCHRAAVAAASRETVLILDIAASRSSLIMVEEGNLQFTSSIPIAGSSFTDSIARALGIAGAKAEEVKRKVGISSTAEYPNIKTALLPVLDNLSAEVRNILKFHGEHSDKKVEKVILAGGGAKLKNLAEFLGPQMIEAGVAKVVLANPWQNLGGMQQPPMDPVESLGYVTAIGLAARGASYEVF